MVEWLNRLLRRNKKRPAYLWVEACESCHIAYPRWVRGLQGHIDPETRAYSWRGFDVVQDGPLFLRKHVCHRRDWDVAWRRTGTRGTDNGNYLRHVSWDQAVVVSADRAVFLKEVNNG